MSIYVHITEFLFRPEVYKEALENADYCHIDELKKYILAKPGKQVQRTPDYLRSTGRR